MKKLLLVSLLVLGLSGCTGADEPNPEIVAQGKVTGQSCQLVPGGRWNPMTQGNCYAVIDVGGKPQAYRTGRPNDEMVGKEVLVIKSSDSAFRLLPMSAPE